MKYDYKEEIDSLKFWSCDIDDRIQQIESNYGEHERIFVDKIKELEKWYSEKVEKLESILSKNDKRFENIEKRLIELCNKE